jgi:hypothetical protein
MFDNSIRRVDCFYFTRYCRAEKSVFVMECEKKESLSLTRYFQILTKYAHLAAKCTRFSVSSLIIRSMKHM